MAVRVTYLAIAMGGACGTLAALVGSPSSSAPMAEPLPSPMGTLPMRPIGELSRPVTAVHAAASPATPAATSAPTPASAVPASSTVLSASVAATSPPLMPVDTTPPPATKTALLHAEMHCDQKNAAACILAARGYETGSAGVTDADKAAKYRKIALTEWIGQCDHNSAPACATLADMYRAGRGVPQSDRKANALIVRTRELCRYNVAPVCHELPPAH